MILHQIGIYGGGVRKKGGGVSDGDLEGFARLADRTAFVERLLKGRGREL